MGTKNVQRSRSKRRASLQRNRSGQLATKKMPEKGGAEVYGDRWKILAVVQ